MYVPPAGLRTAHLANLTTASPARGREAAGDGDSHFMRMLSAQEQQGLMERTKVPEYQARQRHRAEKRRL